MVAEGETWLELESGHLERRTHLQFDGVFSQASHYRLTLFLCSLLQHLSDLFYWIFVPLIQAELNDFQTWWNQHRIRSQPNKDMPSGHVPAHALRHPEQFAGLNCLIPVPTEAVQELRKILVEDVGSYEDHMSWYSPDFRRLAEETYVKLSHPPITLDNAWKVFQSMSNAMECRM